MSPQGGYAAYRYAQPAGTAAAAYSDRYVGFLFPSECHLKVLCDGFIVNNQDFIYILKTFLKTLRFAYLP